MPLAFVLAYLMRFVFERRGQLILLELVLMSLFSGYLVRIYAWRTILGSRACSTARSSSSGSSHEPLTFLIYSNFAVVVTLVGLLLPLAVLPVYSSMANVSRDYLEVAQDLGARRLHLVRTVLLPMIAARRRRRLRLLVPARRGRLRHPALVGGTQSIMIGNVIADQFRGVGANWPLGRGARVPVVVIVIVTV